MARTKAIVIRKDGVSYKFSEPDLSGLATKQEIEALATKQELKNYATKTEVYLKPISSAHDFFVSNTGNDTTADGSRTKPFKTLFACYSYIRNNFYFASMSGVKTLTQTIKFLTDYTETADVLEFFPILNSGISTRLRIIVDGAGKTVKLKAVSLKNSFIIFKNITFLGSGGHAVRSDGVSFNVLQNCSIDTSANTEQEDKSTIYLRYRANIFIIGNLNINLSGNNIIRFIHADLFSEVNFSENSQLIINKSFSVKDALFFGSSFAMIRFHKTFKFVFNNQATVTGKKYSAVGNSIIASSNKGAGFIPGSIAGTIQTQGQYI